MRALGSAVIVTVVVALAACGSGNGHAREIAKLQKAFRQAGLGAHVVDRHAETVGPPKIRGCDPPVIAVSPDGAIATIYVCADPAHALSSKVPIAYPGRRFVRGRIIAVVNGSPPFTKRVQNVLRATVA